MFDNVCKFLAESFSADFATWFFGQPLALTQLSPSELSLEPIRADALILLTNAEVVLHLEFQTEAEEQIPFRMLDYRVRVYRRFPHKQMRQVVIYLKPTGSALVHQQEFAIPGTRHTFEVIRLWEQPSEQFLQTPGLLPFAALGASDSSENTLNQVARKIEAISDLRTQSNVSAASAILAGLVLEKEVIQRLLRQDIMRESVIYQDIWQEGRQEGRQEGLNLERALVVRQLTWRLGTLPQKLENKVQSLSHSQLERLGEALLDFIQLSELEDWLNSQVNNL
uniref:DUF4351 domain-containing protein n=1 Tax=Cyanothece sp. (strain PCC 7425 / ATCC 29141) TaxID=395961 RepID=B8HS79_CYAP4